MAKCDLSIELDQPDRLFRGGETVSGKVYVTADGDVKCTGLEVSSGWRTHGRGNVATGVVQSTILFSGEWKAGEVAEYRFELPVGHWPPTYHGHYLSIDHGIDARIKIPWGIDPKSFVPFQMEPSCGAEGATVPSQAKEVRGVLGCVLGTFLLVFVAIFSVAILAAGPFALVFLLVPLFGLAVRFVRKVLPKYVLGEIRHELHTTSVCPGEQVSGELYLCPRKAVSINGIVVTIHAREQCVSGSGTDRTTHKHVLFEQIETLQEAVKLDPGREYRFPIEITLPPDAPLSIKLDDNELIWSAIIRVDIPRWPDWVQEVPLEIVPDGRGSDGSSTNSDSNVSIDSQAPDRLSIPIGEETITFAETAKHLWAARSRREQVETLVDAVTGLSFEFAAEIERRLLYGGDEDPHVYRDGYAVWARYPDPELPLVLYVPHELADEFEQIGSDVWRGRGTVVGWDGLHGRLQIKLDRTQNETS